MKVNKRRGRPFGALPPIREAEREPLEFRGGAREFLACRGPEVLISGPAGSGKSSALLWKIHAACEFAPGVRCLLVRKTRESLTESGLVTFEQKILPPRHPSMLKAPQRRLRTNYRYPNGSEIVVGGLDKPSKIMSTEYDIVACQEATELRQEDWEALSTRLRNNKLPFQQIIGDCNPSAPTHWLYQRHLEGRLKLIESRHEDNPAYYDARRQEWTLLGRKYLDNLAASLSGVALERLLRGRWVQAEGVIYAAWRDDKHLIYKADLPGGGEWPPLDWRRFWSVDFGFTAPFVCQFWAMDGDGRLYLYREIYKTQTLVQDHAVRMLGIWSEEAAWWSEKRKIALESAHAMTRPEFVVCDHDAEDRATLERHLGLTTLGARKYVRKGIQALSERLLPAGDGRPRLFVVADGIDELDPLLLAARKPRRFQEEVCQYCWNSAKDAPIKENDHACFVAGTLVTTRAGQVSIERIRAGDLVLTRQGYRPVLAAGMTDPAAEVLTVTFEDGRTLTGTADHPVWSETANDFVRLDSLRYDDEVINLTQLEIDKWRSSFYRADQPTSSESGWVASSTGGIPTRNSRAAGTTSDAAWQMPCAASPPCTVIFGSTIVAPYRLATTSIMPTEIHSITGSRISSASRSWSIMPGTLLIRRHEEQHAGPSWARANGSECRMLRHSGMALMKGLPGIESMPGRSSGTGHLAITSASSVASPTRPRGLTGTASALSTARPRHVVSLGSMTSSAIALPAPGVSRSTATRRSASAPVVALLVPRRESPSSRELAPAAASSTRPCPMPRSDTARARVRTVTGGSSVQPVYNLTVDGVHEYYANGILVANCDAARYLVMQTDFGISGLWETAEPIPAQPRAHGPAATFEGIHGGGVTRIRFGDQGVSSRRGNRLFGGS